jgi:hypothetical protein
MATTMDGVLKDFLQTTSSRLPFTSPIEKRLLSWKKVKYIRFCYDAINTVDLYNQRIVYARLLTKNTFYWMNQLGAPELFLPV